VNERLYNRPTENNRSVAPLGATRVLTQPVEAICDAGGWGASCLVTVTFVQSLEVFSFVGLAGQPLTSAAK